jgi:hypothetical protein
MDGPLLPGLHLGGNTTILSRRAMAKGQLTPGFLTAPEIFQGQFADFEMNVLRFPIKPLGTVWGHKKSLSKDRKGR